MQKPQTVLINCLRFQSVLGAAVRCCKKRMFNSKRKAVAYDEQSATALGFMT